MLICTEAIEIGAAWQIPLTVWSKSDTGMHRVARTLPSIARCINVYWRLQSGQGCLDEPFRVLMN